MSGAIEKIRIAIIANIPYAMLIFSCQSNPSFAISREKSDTEI
jgi:hypothetical protein